MIKRTFTEKSACEPAAARISMISLIWKETDSIQTPEYTTDYCFDNMTTVHQYRWTVLCFRVWVRINRGHTFSLLTRIKICS